MPTLYNPQGWSKTAASNDGADSFFGAIADTSYPRPVLDWYRGDMAAIKRYAGDVGGGLIAGGSANALTVTTNQNLSAAHLAAGLCLAVRATAANTSATVTFAPDGLTAANVKCSDGSSLGIGQIKAGMPLILFYNAGSSEWRAGNLISSSGGDVGASTGSFLATATSPQKPSTFPTQILVPIEIFDSGNLYSGNRWTPPAGKVLITASALFEGPINGTGALALYKDGAEYKTARTVPRAARTNEYGGSYSNVSYSLSVTVVDSATGNNYYELYAFSGNPDYIGIDFPKSVWFSGTLV